MLNSVISPIWCYGTRSPTSRDIGEILRDIMMTSLQRTARHVELSVAHEDHKKGLTARAFFKTGNRVSSDDLVQETFTKMWVYLAEGGEVREMKAFLYRILNNLIVDEYRKRKHATLSLDVLLEKGYEPSFDHSERLFNMLDGEQVLLSVHRLPFALQEVIRMRYVQELSITEISVRIGQSRNAIAVRIHRGLTRLRFLNRIA